MLASKHCISSVLAQRCQLERAGNRAAVRKRVLGGTGRERKIRLRPALLGLFERKEIVQMRPVHDLSECASTLVDEEVGNRSVPPEEAKVRASWAASSCL